MNEIRRVIGMIKYLERLLSVLSTTMKPTTDLLKSNIARLWGPSQQKAFGEMKDDQETRPLI